MKKLSIIIPILLWTSLVHSQTNKHISRNEAVTLIEQLSAQITELYVLQNKTEKIDTQLNNYLQNIDNSAPLEIEKFIESVNQVLYHSSNDHHLKLIYNPEKYKAYHWLLIMNKLKTKYNVLALCKPESLSLSITLLAI